MESQDRLIDFGGFIGIGIRIFIGIIQIIK